MGRKSVTQYEIIADAETIDKQIDRMRSQYGSLHPVDSVSADVEVTAQFHGEGVDNKSTFLVDEIKSRAQRKKTYRR